MFAGNAIFKGALMHRRYQPTRHELRYSVADVLVDVDQLEDLNQKSRLIGHNRRRLFSIDDKNHGPGDGTPIAQHVRRLLQQLDLAEPIARIFMLCYPAVFGKVFNPLTVYFGHAADGRWLGVIYEVSNTFGERHSYVLPVQGAAHKAEKCFYVSPFNKVAGEYRFSIEHEQGHLRLNIALFEADKLILAARFDGREQPLSDFALLCGALSLATQPLKVVVGIHWEALKLYLKGLRPTSRPAHGRFKATATPNPRATNSKPAVLRG
jgi:DUF1365 family protein